MNGRLGHSLDRYMKAQLRLAGGRRKPGRDGLSSDITRGQGPTVYLRDLRDLRADYETAQRSADGLSELGRRRHPLDATHLRVHGRWRRPAQYDPHILRTVSSLQQLLWPELECWLARLAATCVLIHLFARRAHRASAISSNADVAAQAPMEEI